MLDRTKRNDRNQLVLELEAAQQKLDNERNRFAFRLATLLNERHAISDVSFSLLSDSCDPVPGMALPATRFSGMGTVDPSSSPESDPVLSSTSKDLSAANIRQIREIMKEAHEAAKCEGAGCHLLERQARRCVLLCLLVFAIL